MVKRQDFGVEGVGKCRSPSTDNDDDRNEKEDDGKVQVVHTTDNRGTVAGLHAASSSIRKLRDHTRHPNQKSYDQSPEGSL